MTPSGPLGRCAFIGRLDLCRHRLALNYAFYAQQDTLTPALVGILSVGVYLAVALTLIQPLGMLGLVLADSTKHLSHQ